MSTSEAQKEYTPKFLTPPVTPKKGIAYQENRLKQGFSPSLFLQNFNFPLPFRKKKPNKQNSNTSGFPTPYRTLYHPRIAQPKIFRRSELIELANFGVVEIEPTESGIGHNFEPVQFKNPTWCDRCGDFVWGACSSQQCLQCQNCSFTCHLRCQDLVTLDCKGQGEMETKDLNTPCSGSSDEQKNGQNGRLSPLFSEDLSKDELLSRITSYNHQDPGLEMILQEDGSVRGFVRVRMNLMRPINVLAGTRPPSIYNILKEEEDSGRKTLTSFYLPKDTIKALHITSEYTARELIVALLKKFKVADNPHKFALYESCIDEESKEVKLRKLQDTEKPLWLALDWSSRAKQFVLQENDNSDVEWEDFALPELQNFLKILDLEEEEYLSQLRLKYQTMREKIKEAMDAFQSQEAQQSEESAQSTS